MYQASKTNPRKPGPDPAQAYLAAGEKRVGKTAGLF